MRSASVVLFAFAGVAVASGSSALQRSRVLRGGGSRSTITLPTKDLAPVQDAAPAAIQLKILERPAEGSTIALGSASYGALQLKPGDRVLVRKMTKARLWSNVPDFLVGEVAEDPCLEAGGVCVPAADITTLKLRAGDDVLVAPMLSPGNSTGAAAATAAATDATQVEGAGRYRYRRRNGWMRTAMWMMYGRPYGHGYGYGYGHGYGRHKPSGYGRRSTSYRSVRKSYGSGRRVGGRRR